jgi:hypothetical protein
MALIPKGRAEASQAYEEASWFADWSDYGGIALLAGDRLYLSRQRAMIAKPVRRSTASDAASSTHRRQTRSQRF